MKALYRLFPTLLVALLLDGLTKIWMEQMLSPYQPVPVVGNVVRWTLGYNTGVAFGLLANGGPWPLIITGLIIGGLLVWFIRALYQAELPLLAAWPSGLLLGGALGNFGDRLFDGRVTDFIDVGLGTTRWPTFNLADSFILIGISLLILLTYRPAPESDSTPVSGETDRFPT